MNEKPVFAAARPDATLSESSNAAGGQAKFPVLQADRPQSARVAVPRARGRLRSLLLPVIMQKFLSNLLIFSALSLCALCAFQWVRESHLRRDIADLQHTVYLKLDMIQNLEAQLKQAKEEITRLDNLRVELSGIIKTNREEIQGLTKYSEKLEKEIEANKAQIAVYKEAIDKANENIKRQNEDIKKQNEEMKQLAADRNATVEKYNKVVEQYNDLVKQFEKFQEEAAKGAKGTEKK